MDRAEEIVEGFRKEKWYSKSSRVTLITVEIEGEADMMELRKRLNDKGIDTTQKGNVLAIKG